MGYKKSKYKLLIITLGLLYFISCRCEFYDNAQIIDRKPVIEPDYSDVTIPPNIAPMNFIIKEVGNNFGITATSVSGKHQISIKSSDGVIQFPEKAWRKLLRECMDDTIKIQVYSSLDNNSFAKYKPFYMKVSDDSIDPYITYRLIPPGYYSWSEIKIRQRSLESFREKSILENRILKMNCVNCHSFNQYDPDRFMVHIRGSEGGTYFVDEGKISRTDLKIESMPGGATYPSWHPGGRYVAFSSNQVRQTFYAQPEKSIEVYDLVSSLILYDRKSNEIFNIPDHDTTQYLLTFPSWSPDGNYLYFCRAVQNNPGAVPDLTDMENTKYSLARKSFDPDSKVFGESEIVFDAAVLNKSASFPRISPNGRYLIFTLHNYGTFPIWHQEADLYLLNLENKEYRKMSLNSDETDSYHSWSDNGKWLVFSSKRSDGRSTRFYFSYIDTLGHSSKPFIMPQKDPDLYNRMIESFNVPEFVKGKIKITPRDFESATKQASIRALKGNPLDSLSQWAKDQANVKRNETDRPIHQ